MTSTNKNYNFWWNFALLSRYFSPQVYFLAYITFVTLFHVYMQFLLKKTCDIERFLNECRKAKTKIITLTNHNGNKTENESIINRSKYK